MDWGNAIVREITKDNGNIIQLSGVMHLEGSRFQLNHGSKVILASIVGTFVYEMYMKI